MIKNNTDSNKPTTHINTDLNRQFIDSMKLNEKSLERSDIDSIKVKQVKRLNTDLNRQFIDSMKLNEKSLERSDIDSIKVKQVKQLIMNAIGEKSDLSQFLGSLSMLDEVDVRIVLSYTKGKGVTLDFFSLKYELENHMFLDVKRVCSGESTEVSIGFGYYQSRGMVVVEKNGILRGIVKFVVADLRRAVTGVSEEIWRVVSGVSLIGSVVYDYTRKVFNVDQFQVEVFDKNVVVYPSISFEDISLFSLLMEPARLLDMVEHKPDFLKRFLDRGIMVIESLECSLSRIRLSFSYHYVSGDPFCFDCGTIEPIEFKDFTNDAFLDSIGMMEYYHSIENSSNTVKFIKEVIQEFKFGFLISKTETGLSYKIKVSTNVKIFGVDTFLKGKLKKLEESDLKLSFSAKFKNARINIGDVVKDLLDLNMNHPVTEFLSKISVIPRDLSVSFGGSGPEFESKVGIELGEILCDTKLVANKEKLSFCADFEQHGRSGIGLVGLLDIDILQKLSTEFIEVYLESFSLDYYFKSKNKTVLLIPCRLEFGDFWPLNAINMREFRFPLTVKDGKPAIDFQLGENLYVCSTFILISPLFSLSVSGASVNISFIYLRNGIDRKDANNMELLTDPKNSIASFTGTLELNWMNRIIMGKLDLSNNGELINMGEIWLPLKFLLLKAYISIEGGLSAPAFSIGGTVKFNFESVNIEASAHVSILPDGKPVTLFAAMKNLTFVNIIKAIIGLDDSICRVIEIAQSFYGMVDECMVYANIKGGAVFDTSSVKLPDCPLDLEGLSSKRGIAFYCKSKGILEMMICFAALFEVNFPPSGLLTFQVYIKRTEISFGDIRVLTIGGVEKSDLEVDLTLEVSVSSVYFHLEFDCLIDIHLLGLKIESRFKLENEEGEKSSAVLSAALNFNGIILQGNVRLGLAQINGPMGITLPKPTFVRLEMELIIPENFVQKLVACIKEVAEKGLKKLRKEIDKVKEKAKKSLPWGLSHICCALLSAADFLVSIAEKGMSVISDFLLQIGGAIDKALSFNGDIRTLGLVKADGTVQGMISVDMTVLGTHLQFCLNIDFNIKKIISQLAKHIFSLIMGLQEKSINSTVLGAFDSDRKLGTPDNIGVEFVTLNPVASNQKLRSERADISKKDLEALKRSAAELKTLIASTTPHAPTFTTDDLMDDPDTFCPYCSKKVEKRALKDHLKVCEDVSVSCENCKTIYKRKEKAKHVCSTDHVKEPTFEEHICEVCGKNYIHREVHDLVCNKDPCPRCHSIVPIDHECSVCQACGKLIINKSNHEAECLVCRHCDTKYETLEELDLHEPICTQIKLPCSYCGQSFPSTELSDHLSSCKSKKMSCSPGCDRTLDPEDILEDRQFSKRCEYCLNYTENTLERMIEHMKECKSVKEVCSYCNEEKYVVSMRDHYCNSYDGTQECDKAQCPKCEELLPDNAREHFEYCFDVTCILGCGDIIKSNEPESMLEHIRECKKLTIKCRYCQKLVPCNKVSYVKHLFSCQNFKIRCPLEVDSEAVYTYLELISHTQHNCNESEVTCSQIANCDKRFRIKDEEVHLKLECEGVQIICPWDVTCNEMISFRDAAKHGVEMHSYYPSLQELELNEYQGVDLSQNLMSIVVMERALLTHRNKDLRKLKQIEYLESGLISRKKIHGIQQCKFCAEPVPHQILPYHHARECINNMEQCDCGESYAVKDKHFHLLEKCKNKRVTCYLCQEEVILNEIPVHLGRDCKMVSAVLPCIFCGERPNEGLEIHHNNCPKGLEKIKCIYCEKVVTKIGYVEHCMLNCKTAQKCSFCNSDVNMDDMPNHVLHECHGLTCKFCGDISITSGHMEKCDERDIFCPLCTQVFSGKEIVSHALYECESLKLKTRCAKCDEEVDQKQYLEHLIMECSDKIVCEFCEPANEIDRELYTHHLKHECEFNMVNCQYCHLQMKEYEMEEHLDPYESDGCSEIPGNCGWCDREISNRGTLIQHMKTCEDRYVIPHGDVTQYYFQHSPNNVSHVLEERQRTGVDHALGWFFTAGIYQAPKYKICTVCYQEENGQFCKVVCKVCAQDIAGREKEDCMKRIREIECQICKKDVQSQGGEECTNAMIKFKDISPSPIYFKDVDYKVYKMMQLENTN
eukprot:TRINITY_DN31_c2_g1_i1.p1 TRINITY_DN31_c2_g1~~TRINITY_DN31_c2_g1_i1.p1  ORF type:complete len:2119 (+),score=338.19 TRINITY_DN31_c2_g1_i1:113-6469(+)